MRVAIVGSRDFPEPHTIQRAIAKLVLEHGSALTIVSGGARGADSIAEAEARRRGVNVIVHLPNWDHFGRSAGFVRNRQIVNDADMLLAFFAPGPLSSGTKHSVSLAFEKGIPAHIYHEGHWISQNV